jgi:hypothetical protein
VRGGGIIALEEKAKGINRGQGMGVAMLVRGRKGTIEHVNSAILHRVIGIVNFTSLTGYQKLLSTFLRSPIEEIRDFPPTTEQHDARLFQSCHLRAAPS